MNTIRKKYPKKWPQDGPLSCYDNCKMNYSYRASFHGGGAYSVTLESRLKTESAAAICEIPSGKRKHFFVC